ncbi:hypothetical protein, partial [Nannocystis sp.]|uniref:hypothetical protein n=1 Tax=Nannocystis sp. TaxID=1962667 RepID=UPI0025CC1709
MADTTLEQALAAVKCENHALADQLRQARSDLHRLGVADQNRVLVYGEVLPAGTRLPDQVGEAIYVIERTGAAAIVEDFAVLLIQYGLAESGGAYPSWPTQTRDGIFPRPQPLHPTALNPRMPTMEQPPPSRSPRKTCPRGHYFVVAGDYFADEAMLTSLEWFHGADFVNGRVWCRPGSAGSIQLAKHSAIHRFPEQEGPLYTITPLLEQVTL